MRWLDGITDLMDMRKNFPKKIFMRNAGLEEAQAGIKIARTNINNLRYADGTTFIAKVKRTKEVLDESERGE